MGFNQDESSQSLKFLGAPVKSTVDKFALVPAFLQSRGLMKEHIASFNYFINHEIKKIVKANSHLECKHDPDIFLRYLNIVVHEPSFTIDRHDEKITPHLCRLLDRTFCFIHDQPEGGWLHKCKLIAEHKFILKIQGKVSDHKSYSAPIKVDVVYRRGFKENRETITKKGVLIGYMPIMLRSSRCVLSGKDEAELAKLGECPLDPGGYFVVKGTEKVILMQEQLSKNRIIIDTDYKGRLSASVTCSTHETKSKTVIFRDKGKIYLQLNQFNKPIPIMIIMKAMGMESDQEVVQMIGRDPRYADLLLPSIQECSSENIYTQLQAFRHLDKMVGRANAARPGSIKEGLAKAILLDVFLAHVPVKKENFRIKCLYAAVMLRRMMDAILNPDTFDDKDYVGNKRLELSGQLVSLLFEDLFKTLNSTAVDFINKRFESGTTPNAPFDFCSQISGKATITDGMVRALSTGNWDLKRFKMHRKGVSQVVSRLSYIAALGHMTRISPQFEKTRKVSGPRALQPSQWGMLCPCDTPEGEACGLTKNLALMTHVTTDEEEGPLISLCYTLGIDDLDIVSGEELHDSSSFLVVFNGLLLGKHSRPQRFATHMRNLRRCGKIGPFVSVFVNEKQGCVYVASDGGRVCRPLVIADQGVSRIKENHMKELQDGLRNFDDFLRDGLIEYLDVNEENNALIALYESNDSADCIKEDRSYVTHIEIEPFTMLGICAGIIPFPHHNQSPRNTYQCAMGKQAMGNIAYNQLFRADGLLYLLVYPQRPLLTTRTIELIRFDKVGAGQNATVAVMSYSGYDIEDAIVMNKSSLDRGFGRCIAMKKKPVVREKYSNGASDRIVKPRKDKLGRGWQILDADGIAAPGEIISYDDVLVNKESPINTRDKILGSLKDDQYRRTTARYKDTSSKGETTVVDRVILCSDTDDKLCIKFMIRHTRRPELGDKFSSRHGQKGVCGTIVQQEDFPFSERGICPDLIMNPHGYPSRMTIGKMIELLGGKAGVSCGRFHYGSAFGEPSGHADKVEDIRYMTSYYRQGSGNDSALKFDEFSFSNTLVRHGFSYSGKDFIYSGITGYPLQAYIFMGPIYYQKLKHMVLDKMHARATGPRVTLTRQPTEGRSKMGGLRVGEMERDCLIAYGASMLIYERLLLSSDPYQVQVCGECGLLGYYNHKLKRALCSMCKNGENMCTMKMPYACKLLFQELQSMNVVPRLKLKEA